MPRRRHQAAAGPPRPPGPLLGAGVWRLGVAGEVGGWANAALAGTVGGSGLTRTGQGLRLTTACTCACPSGSCAGEWAMTRPWHWAPRIPYCWTGGVFYPRSPGRFAYRPDLRHPVADKLTPRRRPGRAGSARRHQPVGAAATIESRLADLLGHAGGTRSLPEALRNFSMHLPMYDSSVWRSSSPWRNRTPSSPCRLKLHDTVTSS